MHVFTLLFGNKSIFTHQATDREDFISRLVDIVPRYYLLYKSYNRSGITYQRNPMLRAFNHTDVNEKTPFETIFVDPLVEEYLDEIEHPTEPDQIEIAMNLEWVRQRVQEIMESHSHRIELLPPFELASSSWDSQSYQGKLMMRRTVGLFNNNRCILVHQFSHEYPVEDDELTMQQYMSEYIVKMTKHISRYGYKLNYGSKYPSDVYEIIRDDIQDDLPYPELVENLLVPFMVWRRDNFDPHHSYEPATEFIQDAGLKVIEISPFKIKI